MEVSFRSLIKKWEAEPLVLLAPQAFLSQRSLLNHLYHQALRQKGNSLRVGVRDYSVHSSLERPNVAHLAQTARISLSPQEAEEFAPKIQQVVDWFGQLQDVDLQSIEPSIRADTEAGSVREDSPVTFDNREAIIAAIPSYEEPYIKVPKVLKQE
ncbi:glutamyl-tRNA(Gln) amidotransferase subunit C, chloroplastic/mitochondrial [Artemisia annua]|uniref:Glutamyl-tRNA(Gln) amidotransferase subunit C, chloroplastic/mitochondrial n=1 Tax=Artemisia annua TaxID=35608 RepID=A0A2U1LRK1_ARTAN|nr:glutamyl-tRNA(Gln) amidotransferase subunit C, chloroplastic/mitochondrial [Artemisia annua]